MNEALTMEILQQKFIIGLLFFVRVTALLTTGPFFSNDAVQPQVKVIFSILVAMLMTTAFGGQQPPIVFDVVGLAVLVVKEALVGIILGSCANLPFYAARFAGSLIDFDMGFQTALLFDANAEVPTLVGELFSLMMLMIFFILNGHHFLIEAIYASVKIIPISKFVLTLPTIQQLVRLITSMFIIGVKIAAPVLVALFVTNLSLALLARAAPQINIFVLSFQFKIIAGLLVLFFIVPLLVILMKNTLQLFEQDTMKVLMSIHSG